MQQVRWSSEDPWYEYRRAHIISPLARAVCLSSAHSSGSGRRRQDDSYGKPSGNHFRSGRQKQYITRGYSPFGDMALIGEQLGSMWLLPIGDNLTMGPKDAPQLPTSIESKKLYQFKYFYPFILCEGVGSWCGVNY